MGSPDTAQDEYDFSRTSRWGLRGRMVSNTALLGGSRLIGGVLGFLTLIIVARALDNNIAFAVLLFLHAYMLFFSDVASFKTWHALIRFGSEEIKNDNPLRFGAIIKTGIVIDALAALGAFILSICLFSGFLWLQERIGSEVDNNVLDFLSYDIVILYCTVILFRQINVSIGIFRLFDKFSVLALRALVMPGIRLIGALIVEQQGWGLKGFIVIWFGASLLSYLTLQIFAIIEIAKRGFWPLIRKSTLCRAKEFPGLYSFMFKMNINSTIKSFKRNFPNIAVMLVLGPPLYPIYHVAREISRILSRGIKLFDQVLYPELSHMAVDMNISLLFKTMVRTAIGIGTISFAIASIVLIFGHDILEFAFDSSFTEAPFLAVLLLVSSSLMGISIPFYTVFYVFVRPGIAIYIRLLGTAAYIGLFFILANSFGLFAIGWAAISGAFIEVTIAIGLAVRLINLKKKEALSQK